MNLEEVSFPVRCAFAADLCFLSASSTFVLKGPVPGFVHQTLCRVKFKVVRKLSVGNSTATRRHRPPNRLVCHMF